MLLLFYFSAFHYYIKTIFQISSKTRMVITQCIRNKQNLLKKFLPGFEIKKKVIRYYFKNIAGK